MLPRRPFVGPGRAAVFLEDGVRATLARATLGFLSPFQRDSLVATAYDRPCHSA